MENSMRKTHHVFFIFTLTFLGTLICVPCSWAQENAAAIENVRVLHLSDGSVSIWYDLNGGEGLRFEVVLVVTLEKRQIRPTMISGHVGKDVAFGKDRQILWEAEKEIGGPLEEFQVDLILTTTPVPPPQEKKDETKTEKERLLRSSEANFKLARIGMIGGGGIFLLGGGMTYFGATNKTDSPQDEEQNSKMFGVGIGAMTAGALMFGIGTWGLIDGIHTRGKAKSLPDSSMEETLRFFAGMDGEAYSLAVCGRF